MEHWLRKKTFLPFPLVAESSHLTIFWNMFLYLNNHHLFLETFYRNFVLWLQMFLSCKNKKINFHLKNTLRTTFSWNTSGGCFWIIYICIKTKLWMLVLKVFILLRFIFRANENRDEWRHATFLFCKASQKKLILKNYVGFM